MDNIVYKIVLYCCSHQFYLHAKLELFEGRLRPTNNQAICKTIALLAQAEFGDCDDLVQSQFYSQWCEHLGVPMDDEESINLIKKLYSEIKVCILGSQFLNLSYLDVSVLCVVLF